MFLCAAYLISTKLTKALIIQIKNSQTQLSCFSIADWYEKYSMYFSHSHKTNLLAQKTKWHHDLSGNWGLMLILAAPCVCPLTKYIKWKNSDGQSAHIQQLNEFIQAPRKAGLVMPHFTNVPQTHCPQFCNTSSMRDRKKNNNKKNGSPVTLRGNEVRRRTRH